MNDKPQEVWDILSEILRSLANFAAPGKTTNDIDRLAEKLIAHFEAESINKNYLPKFAKTPFPNVICTSVNGEICHGIPSDYVLQDGDTLMLDMGIRKDGQCADAALTIPIGEVDNQKSRLIWNAKKVLYAGIRVIKNGCSTFDIADALERVAVQNGYVVNRNFGGHAIGKEMHEKPHLFMSVENNSQWYTLKTGQIICVEPHISLKDNKGIPTPNGWTWATVDGKPSAMFEHMVRVEENGYTILTSHIEEGMVKSNVI